MDSKQDKQGILKGAMILGAGVFISRLIGLLYRIPITNILGDVGNGLYSMAYQVYMVILTFTAISMPSALSKLIAEREAVRAYKDAQRVYKIAMIYSVIVASILAGIMWIGADALSMLLFPDAEVGMPIRALAPTVIIATIIAVMRGYFQGLNDMTPTAVSQIIEQVFNVVFSVALAYALSKYTVAVAVTGSTLGTGIGALAGLCILVIIYYWQKPKIKRKMQRSEEYAYESTATILKKIFVMMFPIVISTSVFSVMTLIDQGMVARSLPSSIEYLKDNHLINIIPVPNAELLSTKDIVTHLLGQFSVKYYTLLNVPVSLILQLGAAAIPAIAAGMAVNDYKDVRRKIKMIFKSGLLIAAPAAIGLTVFAEPIIALLFSEPTGGKLLASGAIGLIFMALAQLSAGILQGMGKPSIPTIHAIIACLIKVGINIIVLSIPTWHIYGVIHSTTFCYLIYAVLNIRYLRKHLHMKLNWKKVLIKPSLCASIMGMLSYFIYSGLMFLAPYEKVWIIVIIPIAMVIYLLTGLATQTITKTDLLYIPGGKKIIAFLEG